jgi:putative toxin-antitoxin system antitoxin component (TIGR02293 family)
MQLTQRSGATHEMLKIVIGKNALLNKMTEVQVAKIGVDVSVVFKVAKKANQPLSIFAKDMGTTERTLRRHQESGKKLNVTITQNVIGYAKAYDIGIGYFKEEKRWNIWLDTPNVNFNSQPPRAVIDTQSGRELISSTLKKLEYGFVA